MLLADAMRLAASLGCDLYWDAGQNLWVVASVAYDSDACSLSALELARIQDEEFLAAYIPDRKL